MIAEEELKNKENLLDGRKVLKKLRSKYLGEISSPEEVASSKLSGDRINLYEEGVI
jgi:hypothetical protein